MSRHAAQDEVPEGRSEFALALREALARRQAAELAGQPPRRRRGEGIGPDDVGDRSGGRAVAGGWPASPPAGPRAAVSDPVGIGWPGQPQTAAMAPGAAPGRVGPVRVGPVQPQAAPRQEPPSDGPDGSDGVRPPGVTSSGQDAAGAPSLLPPAAGPAGKPPPGAGWRRAVHVLTRGVINPGESPAERRRRELSTRIRGGAAGCHRIAVISLKGGVGKTTMSVCLGAVLASLRPDRVIAVDANPDRGTLSGKVAVQTAATIRDLLDGLGAVQSYSDIRRYTSQSSDRLEVLASAADPAISDAFDEQDYRRVVRVLEGYYNLVVTDCGTGLLHSAMIGVLDLADQLVVVSTNSVDGANSASATLDWLQAHGHADLVRGSVAVVNSVVPGAGKVDQDLLEAHFASRCRAVTRIPHDEHLEAGAEVELSALSVRTRDALLAFAAAVADGFPR